MTDFQKKYLKYKTKYINNKKSIIKNDSIGGDTSNISDMSDEVATPEPIMTSYELYNSYGHNYKFYDLYQKNPRNIDILSRWIYARFGPFKNKPNIKKLLTKKISDGKIYQILSSNYTKSEDEVYKFQQNLYKTNHIVKKTESIFNVVRETIGHLNIKKTLDIGTEDADFLSAIEKLIGCDSMGLNIRSGYSHYNTYNEAVKNKKIVLYDGVNIPFSDNEFDLVTIIAVIHHVENIDKFMKEACRVSKNIYIKDNDMTTSVAKNNVDIQHELYEGVLHPGRLSPLFVTTNGDVIKLLEQNNFEIKYNKINENFTKPYVVLASKKNK